MASNNVITDIESKNKATSHLNMSGLLFVVGFMGVAFILKDNVNVLVRIPYYIFNLVCSVFLVLPSRYNKGRNHLESIFVLLRKDVSVYRQFIPQSGVGDGSE